MQMLLATLAVCSRLLEEVRQNVYFNLTERRGKKVFIATAQTQVERIRKRKWRRRTAASQFPVGGQNYEFHRRAFSHN